MSNIYISNYKNLEGCKRIDPEYYQEKYFNIINKLRKKNSVPLSKLVVQRKFRSKENSAHQQIFWLRKKTHSVFLIEKENPKLSF